MKIGIADYPAPTGGDRSAAPGEDRLEARRGMFAASIVYLRRPLPELGLA